MTRQRAAILEVIRSDRCRHYTAEEIFELAKEKLPTISRATVYNNLHSLEEEQVIRRITGEDGSARYDSSFIPHGHLYCSSCGQITDFTIPNFNEVLGERADCIVDSYELKIRGICKECKIANNSHGS
jgi:Fe2+ or Zn2+ uptake regulation protein